MLPTGIFSALLSELLSRELQYEVPLAEGEVAPPLLHMATTFGAVLGTMFWR